MRSRYLSYLGLLLTVIVCVMSHRSVVSGSQCKNVSLPLSS